MRAALFSVFLAVAAASSARDDDADLARVAAWMAGEFDTFAQVARDAAAGAAYKHVGAVLRVVPVAGAGLPGPGQAFYLEQALAESEDKPYRQRVVLLTRLDGRLVNRLYRLKQPEAFVGAWREPARLAGLAREELQLDEGCDLFWTRASDTRFTGVAGSRNLPHRVARGDARHLEGRVDRGLHHEPRPGLRRRGRAQVGTPARCGRARFLAAEVAEDSRATACGGCGGSRAGRVAGAPWPPGRPTLAGSLGEVTAQGRVRAWDG